MINRAGAIPRPILIAFADLKASTAALKVPAGLNLTPWRSGVSRRPAPLMQIIHQRRSIMPGKAKPGVPPSPAPSGGRSSAFAAGWLELSYKPFPALGSLLD